jgi:transposase-like protein
MTCHACSAERKRSGRHRNGLQRFKCHQCKRTFTETHQRPLDEMRLPMAKAEMILKMLCEGVSVRSIERLTEVHRDTILRLLALAGQRCEKLLGERIRNVPVTPGGRWFESGHGHTSTALLGRYQRDEASDGESRSIIGNMPSGMIQSSFTDGRNSGADSAVSLCCRKPSIRSRRASMPAQNCRCACASRSIPWAKCQGIGSVELAH